MTLDAGRTRTWRLPRFSALKMLRRQSFSTEMRTILRRALKEGQRSELLGLPQARLQAPDGAAAFRPARRRRRRLEEAPRRAGGRRAG